MPVEYPTHGGKAPTPFTKSLQIVTTMNKKPAKLSKARSQPLNLPNPTFFAESTSCLTSEEVSRLLRDFLLSLPGASLSGLGNQ